MELGRSSGAAPVRGPNGDELFASKEDTIRAAKVDLGRRRVETAFFLDEPNASISTGPPGLGWSFVRPVELMNVLSLTKPPLRSS